MAARVPCLSSRADDIGDSPRRGRGFGGGGGGLLAESVGEGMGKVEPVGEGMGQVIRGVGVGGRRGVLAEPSGGGWGGQVIRGVGGLRHEEWRSATVRTP